MVTGAHDCLLVVMFLKLEECFHLIGQLRCVIEHLGLVLLDGKFGVGCFIFVLYLLCDNPSQR